MGYGSVLRLYPVCGGARQQLIAAVITKNNNELEVKLLNEPLWPFFKITGAFGV
jgi:hypothetical protein